MKTTAGGIYVYFNQGQHLMTHNGFYVADYNNFSPHTIRKVYTVNQDSEVVQFSTYCASSYPSWIRNAIIVAKHLALDWQMMIYKFWCSD